MDKAQPKEVSAFFYFWLPILILLCLASVVYWDKDFFLKWFEGEHGAIEYLTPIILAPGIVYGIKLIKHKDQISPKLGLYWICLVVLACIYFAGEELSWGQHLFQWPTPEEFGKLNDQNETNLHNVSSWFDQKPRLFLELWVFIGGIILPVRRYLDKQSYDEHSWQYWFWPSSVCFPSALLAIVVKLPERAKDLFGLDPFHYDIRYSETQELYFAFFLSLYLTSIYKKLKNA